MKRFLFLITFIAWAATSYAQPVPTSLVRALPTIGDLLIANPKDFRTNGVVAVLGHAYQGDDQGGLYFWDPYNASGTNVNKVLASLFPGASGRWRQLSSFAVTGSTLPPDSTNNLTLVVRNVAELQTLPSNIGLGAVYVEGYIEPNDGGGSWFKYDPTWVGAYDGGIRFQPVDGIGAWVREITLPFTGFPIRWWGGMVTGLESDGIANRAALETARDFASDLGGGAVIVPHGSWTVTNDVPVTWRDNVILIGDSGANLVATEAVNPLIVVNTNNNVGFFNLAFSETTDSGAVVIQDSTNVAMSGCSFVDDYRGVVLNDSGSGSTNVALLFNTFSNVNTHYLNFPTFNDGNGFVRIDYETSLGGGGGGDSLWFADSTSAFLTNSLSGVHIYGNVLTDTSGQNGERELSVVSYDDGGSTSYGQFRIQTQTNYVAQDWEFYRGVENGNNFNRIHMELGNDAGLDDPYALFSMSIADQVKVLLSPGSTDGVRPYLFDTYVTHTEGNLFEVKNAGVLVGSISFEGALTLSTAGNGTDDIYIQPDGALGKFYVKAGSLGLGTGLTWPDLIINPTFMLQGNNPSINGATDTDAPHNWVFIAASGTGTGKGSSVQFETVNSRTTGTSEGTNSVRLHLEAHRTTLTDASATTFATISVPGEGNVGGTVNISVVVNNGTAVQSKSTLVVFDAVNKGGTVTATITPFANATPAVSGASSLTLAITAVASGATVLLKANADTDLAGATLECRWQANLNSDAAFTITPQ